MQSENKNAIQRRVAQFQEYREWAALAQQQTGKSLLTQIREIKALKSYGGECGISDYYWYKLYDDSYQQGRGARDFLGWSLQARLSLALNPRSAVLPAWDKNVFTLMASSAGLPVAPNLACFHPSQRISESLGRHLKTIKEVETFLKNPLIYPIFGKPAYSQQGYGSAYLAGYDPATDRLTLLNGETVALDEFLIRLVKPVDHRYHKPECGFIFQESFRLPPEILAFTNWPAICGVRVICLNGKDGVTPIRAIWKVAAPPNFVDNFSLGKNGNYLADVDLVTGEVSRMVGGFWPKTQTFAANPTSGHKVSGFKLPGWDLILDACQRGGGAFPLLKIHHWDFALTDKGPLILEINDIGGTEIAQVHGQGLLTPPTREFIKRYSNAAAHPWVTRL